MGQNPTRITKVIKVGEFQEGVIQPLPDRRCELCGAVEECRPYGPKGEWICFDCGMKDYETTRKMMDIKLFGTKG